MIRAKIADVVRGDDGQCVDCGAGRGSTWVRTWRIRAVRPWTFLVPEIERRCYDCWIETDLVREDGDRS